MMPFSSDIHWLSVIHSDPSALVTWDVSVSILYARLHGLRDLPYTERLRLLNSRFEDCTLI